LDVNNGRLTPLFGEAAKIDQRVFFLDWSHDGNGLLVLGGIDNRDLKGNAWLVDVNTYSSVNIRQTNYDAREITSASYSPDGTAIVYARATCYQCGSEVWRVAVDKPEQQLLFRIPEFRVEDISWSPDGRYIAFTQWQQTTESHDFAIGELWLMDANGDKKWLLSPAVTGYFKRFGLAWSPNSRQVAFVMNDETTSGKQLGQLHSNIYVADVSSGNISRLTQFSRALTLAPTWSPEGSILAFESNAGGTPGQLELWATWTDGQAIRRIDENRSLTADVNTSNIAIVWLP
jgi:Tol biopolymer transport system component